MRERWPVLLRRALGAILEVAFVVAVSFPALLVGDWVATWVGADPTVTVQSATYRLKDGRILEARSNDESVRLRSEFKGQIAGFHLRGMTSVKQQVTNFTTTILIFLAIAAWAILRHRHQLGAWFRFRWRPAAAGLAVAIGMHAVTAGWGYLLESLSIGLPSWTDIETWGPIAAPILMFAMIALVAPIAEEIYFRGRILAVLGAWFGWRVSLIVTALVFAAIHPLGWLTPLYLTFGMALGVLRYRTGGLIAPIVAHVAFNAVSAVQILGVSTSGSGTGN